MLIKTVAFGNRDEAFIENRFENKTNIIFSNDNNRGKTLLMQALVYSIGYESIFPSGFFPNKYFFYTKIQFNKSEFEFLRKGNSIIVLKNQQLNVFNSISEFKYYFDREIYKLPKIDKEGLLKTVDLSLFYELFFLGQDKRNTSNIIIKGLNNKTDFINMVYALKGLSVVSENKYDIENLKNEKSVLESQIKSEIKKISIIKKNPEIANFISAAANNLDFKNISNQLKDLHSSIAELKKNRNREENRKLKLESLVAELNSLNRSLNEGRVKCSDCGSKNIIFTNDDFEFEISNNFVRQSIIDSIKTNISIKEEIILELNNEIGKEQQQINKLLEKTTPDVKNYILYHEDIFESKSNDNIVVDLQNKLKEIENKIRNNESKIVSDKILKNEILENLLKDMKRYYKKIDSQGLLQFDDLFTKNGVTYSGSEGQEYYFCKLLALNNILAHNFPIIIDSFREGELSSTKEEFMLQEFIKINKQVILTATLKNEEYQADKYYKIKDLNVIDYSLVEDSKILQQRFVPEFNDILVKFSIKE